MNPINAPDPVAAADVSPARKRLLLALGALVLVLGCVIFAIGARYELRQGSCSSTGYNQYGPVPKCGSTSALHMVLIFVGLAIAVSAGMIPWIKGTAVILGVFGAGGIASIVAGIQAGRHSGGFVFLLVAGVVAIVVGVRFSGILIPNRPRRPPAPPPPAPPP